MTDRSLRYEDAGVSIDRGNTLVERIKPLAAATRRAGVVGSLGGFAGIFDLAASGYRDPLLLLCTDGVGTKLKLAVAMDRCQSVGIDLVAMCVNDLVVAGAEPLAFLDYYATGALDLDRAEAVIKGIADGCSQAGAALLGGESAEMPGMYPPGEFDLAGFCMGAVERDRLIDGRLVSDGDAIIGLPSSGLHSNGFSLVRKIIEMRGIGLDTPLGDDTLGAHLLRPTRLYVRPVLALLREGLPVHAMAHITGGGLPENVARVLPDTLSAHLDSTAWQRPRVFAWLQEAGNVPDDDMLRTFNCGIGMTLIVPHRHCDAIVQCLQEQRQPAHQIGEIVPRRGDLAAVVIA